MGAINKCDLEGQVIKMIPYFEEDGSGTVKALKIYLKVYSEHRLGTKRDFEEEVYRYRTDYPIVLVRDEDKLERLVSQNLKIGDFISFKGVISTANDTMTCDCCKRKLPVNEHEGITIIYVHPTTMILRETHADSLSGELPLSSCESIMRYDERSKVSNKVLLLGNLCSDPEYDDTDGKRICLFQLAINRSLYIRHDSSNTRTDYIYVKAMGEWAEYCRDRMKKGSLVSVGGYLQSRNEFNYPFKRHYICPYCGHQGEQYGETMEVVPFLLEAFERLDDSILTKIEDEIEKESLRSAGEIDEPEIDSDQELFVDQDVSEEDPGDEET